METDRSAGAMAGAWSRSETYDTLGTGSGRREGGSHPEIGGETEPLIKSRPKEHHFQVYGRRWFVISVLAVLNISNGMMWVSFSPVADVVAEFYGINALKVNMLSVIFMLTTIPLGVIAMWLLDVKGLRLAIVLASWLNIIGAVLRVVSSVSIPVHLRYPILMGGQTIVALAQPLVMFTPTKMAAVWFPSSQRALANTVITVSNPLGIMIGNLVSPAVARHPSQLFLLNVICMIPAAVAVVMATFGVCSSVPPTPPSASASQPTEPFFQGLKHLMRCGPHWLLAIAFGTSVGLFTEFNTLIEQILCPVGYSDKFAGWCGALMIAVGLIGAAMAAVYVDKTKKFVEVAKCGLSLATVCLIAFVIVARYAHMEVILIILSALVGFFGFAANPVTLELSVECTFPVAEASSAGMLLLSSQIQSLVLILLMEGLARPYDLDLIPNQVCHTQGVLGMAPKDYTIPNLVLCGIGAVTCVIFTAAFKCDFKRMKAEELEASGFSVNRSDPQASQRDSSNQEQEGVEELSHVHNAIHHSSVHS